MRLENFFTAYKKDLIARQKQIEEVILSGQVKDWSHYNYSKLACIPLKMHGYLSISEQISCSYSRCTTDPLLVLRGSF